MTTRQTRTPAQETQVQNDFETFFLPISASLDLGGFTTYGTTDPNIDLSMVNVRYLKDYSTFRGNWVSGTTGPETGGVSIDYVEDDIVLGSDNHFYQRTTNGNPRMDPMSDDGTNWTQLSQQDELGAAPFRLTDRYNPDNLVYRASDAGDGMPANFSLSDANAGLLYVYVGSVNQVGSAVPLPAIGQSNTNWRQVGGGGLNIDGTDGIIRVNAGTDLTSTLSMNDTVATINHDALATTDTTGTPQSPVSGGTVTAITGVTTNATGHVSEVTTTTFTLPVDPDTDTTYTLSAESITGNTEDANLRLSDGTTDMDVTLKGNHGVLIQDTSTGNNQELSWDYVIPEFDNTIGYLQGNLVRDTSGRIFEARNDLTMPVSPATLTDPVTDTTNWLQLSTGSATGITYDLNVRSTGNDSFIDLVPSTGTTDSVQIEASHNISVTSDASNRTIQPGLVIPVYSASSAYSAGDLVVNNFSSALYLARRDIAANGPALTSQSDWRKLSSGQQAFDTIVDTNPVQGSASGTAGGSTLTITGTGQTTVDVTGHNDTVTIDTPVIPSFGGADGTNAGATGLVPAPDADENVDFLRGDGTWATPTDTDTTYDLTATSTTTPNSINVNLVPSSGNTDTIGFVGANGLDIATSTTGQTSTVTFTAPTITPTDPEDTQIAPWVSAASTPNFEGYTSNQTIRHERRVFISLVGDASATPPMYNTSDPYEDFSSSLSGANAAIDATNLTITFTSTNYPSNADVDNNEPHYTYTLVFLENTEERTAVFNSRFITEDTTANTWTIPVSNITFDPSTPTSLTFDSTSTLTVVSDQWLAVGTGTGGTTVAGGTGSIDLGVYERDSTASMSTEVMGVGDQIEFRGLDSIGGQIEVRGVSFDSVSGRYVFDFNPPLTPPSTSSSATPSTLSYFDSDTDITLRYTVDEGTLFVETSPTLPIARQGSTQLTATFVNYNHPTDPTILTFRLTGFDTSDFNNDINIEDYVMEVVNNDGVRVQITQATPPVTFVDNRAARLNPVTASMDVFALENGMVQFRADNSNSDSFIDWSDTDITLASLQVGNNLLGTGDLATAVGTIQRATGGDNLTFSLPGVRFIPNGTTNVIAGFDDARETGLSRIIARGSYVSTDARTFTSVTGPASISRIAPSTNSSAPLSFMVNANGFDDFSDTDITTNKTIHRPGEAIRTLGQNEFTFDGANSMFTVVRSLFVPVGDTGVGFSIVDNRLSQDNFTQAREMDVNVYAPYWFGTAASDPATIADLENLAVEGMNIAIGTRITLTDTDNTPGQTLYFVVPESNNPLRLVNPVSMNRLTPVLLRQITLNDNNSQGVTYDLYNAGSFSSPITYNVTNI